MSTGLKLTFEEYSRMVERGLLDELRDRRIELIYGELREMPAPGPSHADLVDRLNEWSLDHLPRDQVRVRIQNPIAIPQFNSAPMPDVAWVHRGDYSRRHPLPQETLLIIEVSDSTIDSDLGEMAQLYARAGIREYWVIDVQEATIVVHRWPGETGLEDVQSVRGSEELHPLAYPNLSISPAALFATP
jgi:Uma2 family endonuclease